MKNILLVGEWKSPNLGDSVLCNCVYKYLEKHLSHHNLIKFDLSFGYNPTKFQYWLYSKLGRLLCLFNKTTNRDISDNILSLSDLRSKIFIKDIKKIQPIDCIIFCGGQIFLDYFTYCVSEIVIFAENHNIPIFWNACGGSSKLTDTSSRIFIRCINSRMTQVISVRDSINYFKKINPNTILVPDTAVLVSKCYPINSKRTDLIGLSTISHKLINERVDKNVSKDYIVQFWKSLIKKIEGANLKWKFFTNGDPEDYSATKQLLNNLGYHSEDIHISPRPTSDKELVNLISSFDAVVSFRLHSHIIAYSLGIPSYGLAWDKKVIDFFTLANNRNSCSNLGEFSSDKVFDFVLHRNSYRLPNHLIKTTIDHIDNDIINNL